MRRGKKISKMSFDSGSNSGWWKALLSVLKCQSLSPLLILEVPYCFIFFFFLISKDCRANSLTKHKVRCWNKTKKNGPLLPDEEKSEFTKMDRISTLSLLNYTRARTHTHLIFTWKFCKVCRDTKYYYVGLFWDLNHVKYVFLKSSILWSAQLENLKKPFQGYKTSWAPLETREQTKH